MRDALRAGRQEEYFQLLAGLELLLPVSDDQSAYSTEPDTWATWSTEERTHVLAFTSEQALHACLKSHAGRYRRANFASLSETWPDAEWWLAVDPGLPIEGYLPSWFVTQIAQGDTSLPDADRAAGMSAPTQQPGIPDWRAEAAATAWPAPPPMDGPPAGLLPEPNASLADRYSVLPTRRPTADAAESAGFEPAGGFGPPPPQGFDGPMPTRQSTFDSERPTHDSAPPSYPPPSSEDAYGWDAPAEYPPAPSYAPQQEAAYPPPPEHDSRLPAVVGSVQASPWLDEAEAESRLASSAATGDTESFLHILMRSWAFVPLGDEGAPAVRPGEPGFRWHTDLIDGAYTVTAFTSPARLAARYGDRPFVKTTFSRVASQWPGLEYSLYVNPGTEVGANMPGPQVTTLLTWARTQGLIELAQAMERQAESEAGSAPIALTSPEWMQKIVPHHQVKLILERGYDRVAGFVHRFADVEHATTPAALYDALGLVRTDGRFAMTDGEVHVLRWVGYCHDLYQVAYGANDSQSLSQTGGWVVEAPPFTGTGFAPSRDGSRTTEYKVDSVRLPHGARMYRIGANGSSEEVASFDADRREWIQSRFGAGASTWDLTSSTRSQEQQHA
ncbi:SseB family protein [Stackebrandtia soli]|uniref:SseB family protein n=1 Tax=Stackebrandtia soli TaxID=1892856 RepID=UPI0039E79494